MEVVNSNIDRYDYNQCLVLGIQQESFCKPKSSCLCLPLPFLAWKEAHGCHSVSILSNSKGSHLPQWKNLNGRIKGRSLKNCSAVKEKHTKNIQETLVPSVTGHLPTYPPKSQMAGKDSSHVLQQSRTAARGWGLLSASIQCQRDHNQSMTTFSETPLQVLYPLNLLGQKHNYPLPYVLVQEAHFFLIEK